MDFSIVLQELYGNDNIRFKDLLRVLNSLALTNSSSKILNISVCVSDTDGSGNYFSQKGFVNEAVRILILSKQDIFDKRNTLHEEYTTLEKISHEDGYHISYILTEQQPVCGCGDSECGYCNGSITPDPEDIPEKQIVVFRANTRYGYVKFISDSEEEYKLNYLNRDYYLYSDWVKVFG